MAFWSDTSSPRPVCRAVPTLPEAVEASRQEWLSAQAYYNTVGEQDLIDQAAYLILAAERKYMYLLKKARTEGVTHSAYWR